MDLSGIRHVEFANLSKGGAGIYDIEIRANSESGAILGKANFKDAETPDQGNNILVQLNLPADMKINSFYVLFVSDPKNLKPRPLLKTVTFKPE